VIGVRGYLSGCILALAACIGLAVPVLAQVLAQDNSGLAAGKEAWARASCSNCHGSMAQGGDGGDYPVGPSLRNITYGKETMVGIVSCGIPGTPPMPAWLKGAYTTVECYGMPLGSIPTGMTVPAILTADEIKALVDYVFATFVQAPRP
jgi:mono/diheme cytochrome c family protein